MGAIMFEWTSNPQWWIVILLAVVIWNQIGERLQVERSWLNLLDDMEQIRNSLVELQEEAKVMRTALEYIGNNTMELGSATDISER